MGRQILQVLGMPLWRTMNNGDRDVMSEFAVFVTRFVIISLNLHEWIS